MNRAFSLVETIASLSLLTVVMMLIFNLFPTSSVAVHKAQQQLQATSLAQSHLEQMRAQPFAALKIEAEQVAAEPSIGHPLGIAWRQVSRSPDAAMSFSAAT